MTLKNVAILTILVAVISAGLTRYFFPQVEYKNVEIEKEVVRNDVRTIVRTIERPDGSRETVSDTTDRSTRRESRSSETIIAAKPQWMFDLGARLNPSDREVFYDLQAQRRILGPFFLGAKVSTDKTIGLSVGMEF